MNNLNDSPAPVKPTFALRADNPAPRLPFGPDDKPGVNFVEKHRPATIAEMVGQGFAALQLGTFLESPCSCAFFFDGPTGVGKTTAAKALAAELGAVEFGGLYEIKSGAQDAEAVEMALDALRFTPMLGSGWKVVIVDEADYASPKAKQLWLSALEDLPPHSVVIFTTNSPDKFDARFLDRCERISFASDGATLLQDAQTLINRVWHRETGHYDAPLVSSIPGLVAKDGSISFRRAVAACAPMVRAFRSELARCEAETPAPVVEAAPEPTPVMDIPAEAPAVAIELPPLCGGSDDAVATVEAPAKPKRIRKPRAKAAPTPVQEVPAVEATPLEEVSPDLSTLALDCPPPATGITISTADVQAALEAGNDRLVIVTPPARMPRPDPTARFLAARSLVMARADLAQRQAPGPVASRLISDRAVDRLARLRRAAGRCGADRKVIMSTSTPAAGISAPKPPTPPRGIVEAPEVVVIEGRPYRCSAYPVAADGLRSYCLQHGDREYDTSETSDGRAICTCPDFTHRHRPLPFSTGCRHIRGLVALGLVVNRFPSPEPEPSPGSPDETPCGKSPVESEAEPCRASESFRGGIPAPPSDAPISGVTAGNSSASRRSPAPGAWSNASSATGSTCDGPTDGSSSTSSRPGSSRRPCGAPDSIPSAVSRIRHGSTVYERNCTTWRGPGGLTLDFGRADREYVAGRVAILADSPKGVISSDTPATRIPSPSREVPLAPVAGATGKSHPDALERAEEHVLRLEMELAAAKREVGRLRGLAAAEA